MNEEMLKNTLLDIIEEAKNLNESEKEIIPGTNISVKRGKADEYKAYARFYYQLKNNVFINSDDYLEEVYKELNQELTNDLPVDTKEEYDLSKAYDLYSLNKDEIERLNALNKSLTMNLEDRKKYHHSLEELSKRDVTNPKTWEEITNLQNSIKTLADNELIIKNAMAEIKDKVNDAVKKSVEEEMTYIRNHYLNSKVGTKIEFGLDGMSILAEDKENYDNLYILIKIIENVNEKDPIVVVDNTLCVNPHQVDAVKELLPKIKFLKFVKEPIKEEKIEIELENTPKKTNEDLIIKISKELDRLREKIKNENLPSDKEEYDNLIQIANYLNKANQTEFALTPVWDIAYVNGMDREIFTNLLKNTEFFKDYNPDLEKLKENEALIEKLRAYLTALEDKVRQYQGLNNIPLVQTSGAIILPEDKEEYENVLEIINILKNSKENLIHISDGGNVNSKDYPKYKDLMNYTKYFTPDLMAKKIEEQNGPIIKEVEQELTDLIKKAKATPNAVLAEGKEILASDLEKYNLLSRKYAILKNANPNSNLVEVNGALINGDQIEEYKEVITSLNNLKKDPEPGLQKPNEVILKDTENKIQALIAKTTGADPKDIDLNSRVLTSDLEEYDALNTKLNILKNIKPEDDLVEVNGAMTPADKKEEYQSILEKLNKIESQRTTPPTPPKPTKEPLKRKAVKMVRKVANKEWWKKNWKKVALIGVSSTAILFTLSTLAPTLVYANSCLAMANPALSGILGTINNTIINAFGLTLGELNLNIAASQAFVALITALAKLGIVGIGTVGVVKGAKGIIQEDENRLPDPNRKRIANKVLDLGKELIDSSKNLSKNLSEKATEFTRNLAYATDSNNMALQEEVLNAKMGIDPNMEEPVDEKTFKEIEENVQKQIQEKRINERYNQLKEDNTPIELPGKVEEPKESAIQISIPSDEEILSAINDKSVEIGRVDNYIDAIKDGDTKKASEYQKLVLEDTGIDLNQYDMSKYEEVVQARSDVANFMNQISITKRSR